MASSELLPCPGLSSQDWRAGVRLGNMWEEEVGTRHRSLSALPKAGLFLGGELLPQGTCGSGRGRWCAPPGLLQPLRDKHLLMGLHLLPRGAVG